MPSKLKSFKRRAAAFQDQDSVYKGENIRLLFAPGSRFVGVVFSHCELDLATLNNASFDNCSFVECSMIGVNFRAAQLERCTFDSCTLVGTSFEGARLRAVGFSSCEMEGVSFLGTIMQAPVSFVTCSLMNADLRFYECDKDQPAFVRSDLRGVVFAVNCEFWNAGFDERATADFGRVFARASKDEKLIGMVKERWGADAYDSVDRYMRRD